MWTSIEKLSNCVCVCLQEDVGTKKQKTDA